jgi:hypothetical protein
MPLRFEDSPPLTFLVGTEETIERMVSIPPLQPFSEEILSFFDALSKRLLPLGRAHPDVATFAFWCRRSALLREKENYDDLGLRAGRGTVFHSTPSNVPVNFAFSFAAGLLAGNANIVRLPRKEFEQVTLICDAIRELLVEDYSSLAPYVCLLRYPSDRTISDTFSRICDARVIWGGDATIALMRESPLKPRAIELTFADRYSLAVINADTYLKTSDKERVALQFYNDTYYSDQNACTSPRFVFWLGEEKETAKQLFWDHLHQLVKERYELSATFAIDKLDALYRVAAKRDVHAIPDEDNLITRVVPHTLDAKLPDFCSNCGFYFEYDIDTLDEILPVCTTRCQTLSYLGLTEADLREFVTQARPRGIDRAVPLGSSMNFSLIWDGHDLIRTMSRRVTVL